MTPDTCRELDRLLSTLCDEELSELQRTRLQSLLEADPACRQRYLEYLDIHARLLVHPTIGTPQAADEEILQPAGEPTPPAGRLAPGKQAIRYALVACATLVASVLVQVYLWHSVPNVIGEAVPGSNQQSLAEYVATLTETADCIWDGAESPRPPGSRFSRGEFSLQRGLARVRFDSGADLVVEGPAVVRLDSARAATVLRGKVVFHADNTAAPFDLHTPSSTLVDFGTEYAVTVGPEGEEVHVFDGEVQRKSHATTIAEYLKAGEARRYGPAPDRPGQPTALDPDRFVRRLAGRGQKPRDPQAGLLAFEGFDYTNRAALRYGQARGGSGWAGPWVPGFARPADLDDANQEVLNTSQSLLRSRPSTPPIGGSFDFTGFTKYFRKLATPIRLDADGVYYVSFLFRREGPSDDGTNAVALLFWTADEFERMPAGKDDPRERMNLGVRGWNQLFTQLHDMNSRTSLPLRYGETYLFVAKIVASQRSPDQVFMRIYSPDEHLELEETGSWTVTGPLFQSDLVFDWLQVHINSKRRQTIDEIRVGTTWASVTSPWLEAVQGQRKGE